jgi:myo-inositol-1(or 4)-monophosphatase
VLPTEARDIALAVGRDAAALLREATGRIGEVRAKSNPRDWVTEWDERAERLIAAGLEARAPGVALLGEEQGARGDTGGAAGRWLVDPIDGTVNFAHGFPIFGVSIAHEVAGQVQAGVVLAPALGWEFAAARGAGASFGGAPIRVSQVAELQRAMLVTGFPYDRATSAHNNFREWEHFQRVAGACRRLGAASLDLCFVACGWLDGYWEFRLKPWDLAAGSLIVEEAGGRVTAPDGGPFVVDEAEAVATNGLFHDELVRELAPFVAARRAGPPPR